MKKTKDNEMTEAVNQNSTANEEETDEENYPSVFSNRNLSQDLEKLKGQQRKMRKAVGR